MNYVNRPWKKMIVDYNKRKAAMADEPPGEPVKLLMVTRRETLRGVPKTLKKTIQQLGLFEVI